MNCRTNTLRSTDPMDACISRTFVGVLLSFGLTTASAEGNWPEIAFPAKVHPVNVGGQSTVNGLPMRIKGFVAPGTPSQVADAFRKALGQPLVESRVADMLVLSRMQGDFYLSVQIGPSGGGSRGAVAVTNLKLAAESRIDIAAERERWLNRLPAGSRLLSHMTSEDAGKSSSHLVLTNGLADDVNAARIQSMLAEDGMLLERDTKIDGATAGGQYAPRGRTLYFRGPNKEAIAVISHADGDAAIVLNIVTRLQRIQ